MDPSVSPETTQVLSGKELAAVAIEEKTERKRRGVRR